MGQYKNGKLTREGMKAVIDGGGVVMHEGNILRHHHELPLPESMTDSKVERARVKAELLAEHDALIKRITDISGDAEAEESAEDNSDTEGGQADADGDGSIDLDEDGDPKKYQVLKSLAVEKGYNQGGHPSRIDLKAYLKQQKDMGQKVIA